MSSRASATEMSLAFVFRMRRFLVGAEGFILPVGKSFILALGFITVVL